MAGQTKTTRIDGPTLSMKAPNIPLSHVANVTGCDESSVAGVGFAVISDVKQLPSNKFFAPGRVFPVRIKHSSFPGNHFFVLLLQL